MSHIQHGGEVSEQTVDQLIREAREALESGDWITAASKMESADLKAYLNGVSVAPENSGVMFSEMTTRARCIAEGEVVEEEYERLYVHELLGDLLVHRSAE